MQIMKWYVGIDVSKQYLDGAIWHDGQVQQLGRFDNNELGFSQLEQSIAEYVPHSQPVHLVLEPTGGYELKLVGYAYQQQWLVSLPNPKQVRDWAKGIGQRAKTDPLDAHILTHYGAERQPQPQQPLSEEIKTLDSLLKRQDDLAQMRRQELNRLHALHTQPHLSPQVCNSLEHIIAVLEAELLSLQQQIKLFFKQHPALKQQLDQLRQVPGIGTKIAPFILVLFHRWQTLTEGQGTTKQLTAYIGLDPQPFRSGSSVFKRPTISRMGNSNLRRLLYMGALGGVRGHNPLCDFYQRLVGRGKPKKVALVAAARKILTWAWVIFSRGLSFDPKIIDPNFA
jgi:transposase